MSNNYKVYASQQYVDEKLANLNVEQVQVDWAQNDETAPDYRRLNGMILYQMPKRIYGG